MTVEEVAAQNRDRALKAHFKVCTGELAGACATKVAFSWPSRTLGA